MATQILTDAQIAAAAKTAGFSGEGLKKIVAIAIAESSGDTYAHNKIPPDNSYGLTQVNMLGDMGPARRKQFGLSSNEQLFDPVTNMKAAYAISNGGINFRPWSTYTSGAYFAYLPRASKASGSPATTVPGISGGSTQQVGVISTGSEFIDLISDENTWIRFGLIVGGGILVLTALYMISGSKVVNALPVGRIAKIAKKVT